MLEEHKQGEAVLVVLGGSACRVHGILDRGSGRPGSGLLLGLGGSVPESVGGLELGQGLRVVPCLLESQ